MYPKDITPLVGDKVKVNGGRNGIISVIGYVTGIIEKIENIEDINFPPILVQTGRSDFGVLWAHKDEIELIERPFKTHIKIANKEDLDCT